MSKRLATQRESFDSEVEHDVLNDPDHIPSSDPSSEELSVKTQRKSKARGDAKQKKKPKKKPKIASGKSRTKQQEATKDGSPQVAEESDGDAAVEGEEDRPSKKVSMARLLSQYPVIPPNPTAAPPPLRSEPPRQPHSKGRARTDEARWAQSLQQKVFSLKKLHARIPTYVVPETLEGMKAAVNLNTKANRAEWEKQCDQLANTPITPFSTKYVDSTGRVVGVYLGVSPVPDNTESKQRSSNDPGSSKQTKSKGKGVETSSISESANPARPLSEQHQGRTIDDYHRGIAENKKYFRDGLSDELVLLNHYATQAFAADVHPHVHKSDPRHNPVAVTQASHDSPPPPIDKTDADTFREGVAQDPEGVNLDLLTSTHTDTDGNLVRERAGVFHLVQGWPMAGHAHAAGGPNLVLSSDLHKGSKGLASAAHYYMLTREVAEVISKMFEEFFPKEYRKYKRVFDAGIWIMEDPGPWLGRAIVFKLQLYAHMDPSEAGPTVSFPTGFFEGGYMEVPKFQSRFLYQPGDVFISYTGVIAHRVAPWVATPVSAEAAKFGVTPGRIGTVYMENQVSFQVLKDKPAGWGRKTSYGLHAPAEKDAKKMQKAQVELDEMSDVRSISIVLVFIAEFARGGRNPRRVVVEPFCRTDYEIINRTNAIYDNQTSPSTFNDQRLVWASTWAPTDVHEKPYAFTDIYDAREHIANNTTMAHVDVDHLMSKTFKQQFDRRE
ncbi:hypothetical protein BXZ70DRAFT_1018342 [Cristinia sonorae]|uniref:Uncharacterized protein n=1 Tax=Cristinia sonorae TaxID=1940300 RepID=A0A8K0URR6_9AGAR|nr:hypothetical protein BXZ70DRAFT_1018342 [Cristinia sonorae]